MVGRVLQKEKMVLHRSLALFFVKFFLTTYLVGPFFFSLYSLLFLKIFQKQGSLVPKRIMVLIVGQTLSDLSGLK